MRIMALSPLFKISNVCRNSRRLFSYKFEMTPANSNSPAQRGSNAAVAEQAEDHHQDEHSIHPTSGFRYNVCQPRTSPVEKPSTVGDIVATQKLHVKAAIEEQHLQPSMLPEYFTKPMERNALVNPQPDPSEQDRINKGIAPIDTRRFQVSKTYANAILPLKTVKLANPFPEPVKMMMSRTVSDEEKAEQMLAEAKSARQYNDWTKIGTNSRNFSTIAKRFYSSQKGGSEDTKKCKKFGKQGKQCPKMKLDCCPPPARFNCDRIPKQIDCKKQEAPYPAYSEFCHEDIEEKPSECKICPWKPEENPNFKPPKKKFHTDAALRKRADFDDLDGGDATQSADMQLGDLRKPPCDRPKNRRCPPKKEKEKKKEKPKKKCSATCVDELLLGESKSAAAMELASSSGKCKGEEKSKCRIPKFKFPSCCEEPPKAERSSGGKCPPKKKKPKIQDCPGGCGSGTCTKTAPDENLTEAYQMASQYDIGSGSGNDKDKNKCPKVDMTTWEDPEPRCPPKRKDSTKICPNDLTVKKQKGQRKKKTSALDESELNEIQEPKGTQPTPTQPTTTTTI